jgi:hypothetical protein
MRDADNGSVDPDKNECKKSREWAGQGEILVIGHHHVALHSKNG